MPDDIHHSHSELRAALIIAGKHIRSLRPAVKNDPVLKHLRQVLRNSAKFSSKSTARVKIKLPD